MVVEHLSGSDNSSSNLYITGHSLGAAVGTLAMCTLQGGRCLDGKSWKTALIGGDNSFVWSISVCNVFKCDGWVERVALCKDWATMLGSLISSNHLESGIWTLWRPLIRNLRDAFQCIVSLIRAIQYLIFHPDIWRASSTNTSIMRQGLLL